MSYENKSKDQSASRTFELQLTRAQSAALSSLLPSNFSMILASKMKKESSHKPSKKVFTNEGNAIKKTEKEPIPVPKTAPVQKQIELPAHDLGNGYPLAHAHSQIETAANSASSENAAPSTKRTLRDSRKKSQSYLEERFLEPIPPVPMTSSKSLKPINEGTKKCLNLLQKLKKHASVGPFLQPVDVEGLGLYDYYDIVPEPMDISTVEKKLKNGDYSSVSEFGGDVRKIWNNAFAYNTEKSTIYQMTAKISAYFEKLYKEIEDVQFNDKIKELQDQVKKLTQKITELHQPPLPTNSRNNSRSSARPYRSPVSGGGSEDAMSVHEKKVLCDNIKKLQPDCLRGVWEIVSKGLPNQQNSKEELVFDIDALPVRITRELERYVKNKLGLNKSSKGKVKESQGGKTVLNLDVPSYDPNSQYYNHGSKSESNSSKYQAASHPHMGNKGPFMESQKREKNDDAESKSSDSSFISDSESGSDDERSHKVKPAQNYLLKQQDLANFQAGGHGSMLNSFIVQ